MLNPDLCDTFGTRLEYVRMHNNLTKKAMAQSVGVAPSTWAAYENDKSFPSVCTIEAFLDLYNVETVWLYEGEGPIFCDKE